MVEEIFDVVDERDEVIGRETRGEVHRRGLRHRAVHVLVYNADGALFLQKRSMSKDSCPGLWDSSASGHVDAGEDYDACSVREVREELGLVLEAVPERLFKIEACPETAQEHIWVYWCRAEGPFDLHPDEIEAGGWYRPEEISAWVRERPGELAGGLIVIWERLMALRG